jgi:UDP-N-acetylglucosamine diphosphorylase/glucosamine-1-phosphate N-acetyltransferase
MNYLLFDDVKSEHLLPLTFTRPAAELMVGIWTITEKWSFYLGHGVSHIPFRSYLSSKYPATYSHDNCYINGRLLPDTSLISAVQQLGMGESLWLGDDLLAIRSTEKLERFDHASLALMAQQKREYAAEVTIISKPFELFLFNGKQIKSDYAAITQGRKSLPIDGSNRVVGEAIFIEEGAVVVNATLNATAGPIYIGKDAEVMDGAIIRGPFSLGEHSSVKMGAKIYGDTSIGPHSKVGGEVSNSVILGYSNKGHDGFMGNAVIGHWCNWGADTNNSNLKNNYEIVKLWDYVQGRFVSTGLQFCGLIMGDHSKCGINTMFNTGTVIGVGANIFGAGFPRNFLPSFSWGGPQGMETFKLPKFFQTAEKVMERRGILLDAIEKDILTAIYNETARYRSWENQTL